MVQALAQQGQMQSQLRRSRNQALQNRRPASIASGRKNTRPGIMPRTLSRTRTEMLKRQDPESFPNTMRIPQSGMQPEISRAQRLGTEQQHRAQLQQERNRIRSQMKAFRAVPNIDLEEGEEQPYQDAFAQNMDTPEVRESLGKRMSSSQEARGQKQRVSRAKNQASKQAGKATEAARAAKAAKTGGSAVYATGNTLSAVDAAEPFDLEIPTVFAIFVAMYRACTAILHDGKKITKGFVAFIEPEPLFRFWNPADYQKAVASKGADVPYLYDSLLGWLYALLGGFIFATILIFLLVILLIVAIILDPSLIPALILQ